MQYDISTYDSYALCTHTHIHNSLLECKWRETKTRLWTHIYWRAATASTSPYINTSWNGDKDTTRRSSSLKCMPKNGVAIWKSVWCYQGTSLRKRTSSCLYIVDTYFYVEVCVCGCLCGHLCMSVCSACSVTCIVRRPERWKVGGRGMQLALLC